MANGKGGVGGVGVSGMSGATKVHKVTLRTSRNKTTTYTVRPIQPRSSGAPTANLDEYLKEVGLTHADVDRWRASIDKPPLAEGTDEQRAQLAGWLAGDMSRLDPIRALIPEE